jgi:glutathione S-transferase
MSIIKKELNGPLSEQARVYIPRIVNIWSECKNNSSLKGDYLFGDFTIADTMFTPVVCRIYTYEIKVPSLAANYVATMLKWPALQKWQKDAIKSVS